MTKQARLLQYPIARTSGDEFPAEYATLRAEDPVCPIALATGDPAMMVTRFEDAKTVLADRRFSRAAMCAEPASRFQHVWPSPDSLTSMDPPEHTRLRQYVNQFFTVRLIDQLSPRIEQIATGLLAEMALSEPPVDLISAFTRPLPLRVISEMLGIPLADQDRFIPWMDVITRLDATEETILTTYQEMWEYFAEQLAGRRRRPADDLLSSLAQAQADGRLSEYETVGLGTFLLGAGYHTSVTVLTDATLTLLRHPAERAELIANPGLWPNAVEELLRLNGPGASLFPRLALEDVVLSNVLIPRGTTVLVHVAAACRDEAVLDEPERFDPHREIGFHLFFGHGPHYCLGAPLARAELRIGLRRLFERFPRLSLAIPSSELRWQDLAALGGFEEFPVTW